MREPGNGGSRTPSAFEAAQTVGFDLKRGQVVPAPPDEDDDSGWTGYVPLIDSDS